MSVGRTGQYEEYYCIDSLYESWLSSDTNCKGSLYVLNEILGITCQHWYH